MIKYLGATIGLVFAALALPCGSVNAGGLADCGLALVSPCKDMIGKRLWISVPKGQGFVVEFNRTAGQYANPIKLTSGSFLIRAVVQSGEYTNDYAVTLDDGRVGYISTAMWFRLSETDPVEDVRKARAAAVAKREECERRGQPKIGMTAAEVVETCWRQPVRVVKKTTGAGIEENYVYGIGHIIKFTDGKVSEIVEAR